MGDSPSEGERDSLLHVLHTTTSDEGNTLPNYGIQEDYRGRPTNDWEFAGKGEEVVYNNLVVDEEGFEAAKALKYKHALGQLVSTAISGTFKRKIHSPLLGFLFALQIHFYAKMTAV